MATRCPHCNKVAYPMFDDEKSKGWKERWRNEHHLEFKAVFDSIIWKNVIRVDWLMVILIIGIILLLLGFKQINEQCFTFLEKPCQTALKMGCNPKTQMLSNYSLEIPPTSLPEYS